jgi:prepilin-type N-terminal cleavage/methylation domain-containing protein
MNQVQDKFQTDDQAFSHQGGGGRGLLQGASAFTLIEMLTVIAVIGLLAGIAVGLAPRVGQAGRESRIRAQLNQIATAIESFQADFGHYPSDNLVPGTAIVNSVTNSLLYELSGVVIDNVAVPPQFVTRDGLTRMSSTVVNKFFHTDGFENAKADPKELSRAYLQLQPKQHAVISAPPDQVEVLVVPVAWPVSRADQPTTVKGLNPWHYVSTRPTNNAASFDLWAEWVEGNKVKVLSNWSKDVQDRN